MGLRAAEEWYLTRDDRLRCAAARDSGPADARAGQRVLLRAPESGTRRDLRPARRGQFCARRLLYVGRIRGVYRLDVSRHQLLVGAAARAAGGGPFRYCYRAAFLAA